MIFDSQTVKIAAASRVSLVLKCLQTAEGEEKDLKTRRNEFYVMWISIIRIKTRQKNKEGTGEDSRIRSLLLVSEMFYNAPILTSCIIYLFYSGPFKKSLVSLFYPCCAVSPWR